MTTPSFTVTAEDVFTRYGIKDQSEARLAEMTSIIAGIVGVINETTLDWPTDPDDHPGRLAATEEAIFLMAHRVWARKGSPEGAAGFSGTGELIRVTRSDPDVEFFLHPWSNDEIPV